MPCIHCMYVALADPMVHAYFVNLYHLNHPHALLRPPPKRHILNPITDYHTFRTQSLTITHPNNIILHITSIPCAGVLSPTCRATTTTPAPLQSHSAMLCDRSETQPMLTKQTYRCMFPLHTPFLPASCRPRALPPPPTPLQRARCPPAGAASQRETTCRHQVCWPKMVHAHRSTQLLSMYKQHHKRIAGLGRHPGLLPELLGGHPKLLA
jgi:hypothetical protein